MSINTSSTSQIMEGEKNVVDKSKKETLLYHLRLVACLAFILEAILVSMRWRREKTIGKGIKIIIIIIIFKFNI